MANKTGLTPEIEALFLGKQNRCKELAKLPFEEKIRLLVELQKMAQNLPRIGINETRTVWQIEPVLTPTFLDD